MEMHIREIAGATVVAVDGRIDSTTAKAFGERLTGLVRDGVRALVVDLTKIPYISSAGFRMLLTAADAIEQASGQLALVGVTGEVKRLFDLAAFTDLFQLCATPEEAARKVTGAGA